MQCLEGLWEAVQLKQAEQMVVCKQLGTCTSLPLSLVTSILEASGACVGSTHAAHTSSE
jgi:hypothetical protein